MDSCRSTWSMVLFGAGVVGCVAYLALPLSDAVAAGWYLGIASLGTGMAVAGAWRSGPATRPVWVALAVGQILYLAGDCLWTLYEGILHLAPYPSWADAGYLSRYLAVAVGLCLLVRGRRAGGDRATVLDSAIVTSAFALPITMYFILPIFSLSDASMLSMVVAAAYPIGDVLILALLLRLVGTSSARNLSHLSLAAGLVLFLGLDLYYNVVVSLGATLPEWTDAGYGTTYLLIGFAALRDAVDAPTQPIAGTASRPALFGAVMLGGALLVAPGLLAVSALHHSMRDLLVIAVGGAASSLLVLIRLLDLIHYSRSQSAQLAMLARTDSLTGLPNRRSWDHQMERTAAKARAEGTSLTVAMIDLDRFKSFNDTNGHLAGDLALKETAAAWADVLDGNGYLARYGGEEFALFIRDAPRELAQILIKRIHESVARGQTCSIGVAEWQPGESRPEQAVLRADEALYRAKRAGRNRIVWHDDLPGRGVPGGMPAPVGHDLVPFFQPIVNIASGLTVGREALSRFPGMSPTQAFAQAREIGATGALERAAVAAALAEDHGPGWLAVNVSLSTILDAGLDEMLPTDLSNIVFEITEYEFLQDTQSATERLHQLRGRGARIAIDDLGVGFSSLDRLLWLEPEIIKLDMSIVRGINAKPGHAAMVRAMTGYATSTGAQLCAEGVETAEERLVLIAAGVELAQGHLFGRPQPARTAGALEPDQSLHPSTQRSGSVSG